MSKLSLDPYPTYPTSHTGRWQRPTIVHGDVVKIHIACGCLSPVPDVKGTIWFIALECFGLETLNTTRFANNDIACTLIARTQ